MVKIIFVSPTYPPGECFVWSAQHPSPLLRLTPTAFPLGKLSSAASSCFQDETDSCCFSTRVPAPWNQGPYLIHCCSSTGLPEWSQGRPCTLVNFVYWARGWVRTGSWEFTRTPLRGLSPLRERKTLCSHKSAIFWPSIQLHPLLGSTFFQIVCPQGSPFSYSCNGTV